MNQIRQFLESRNILKSQEELNDELDLPIVMISKPKNSDEAFASTVLSDYFQTRGFEVKVVEASEKTDAMVDSILA